MEKLMQIKISCCAPSGLLLLLFNIHISDFLLHIPNLWQVVRKLWRKNKSMKKRNVNLVNVNRVIRPTIKSKISSWRKSDHEWSDHFAYYFILLLIFSLPLVQWWQQRIPIDCEMHEEANSKWKSMADHKIVEIWYIIR